MSEVYYNYVTDASKNEITAVANRLSTIISSNSTATQDESIAFAQEILTIYNRLKTARTMGFTVLDSTKGATYDALLTKLSTVASAYYAYDSSPTAANKTAVKTAISGLNAENTAFVAMLPSLLKSWSIQDRVFYEYSKTGEADLNTQLGMLGDALDSISRVIDVINDIDLALSIEPRHNTSGASLVLSDGTLDSTYNTVGSTSLMITTTTPPTNAAQYVYNAYQQLVALKSGFPSGGAVYNAIGDAIAALQNAGVTSWNNAPAPGTGGTVWTQFKAFWENQTVRRKVNDLQTTLASQNDVEKENLRKAMFIYQEFVKSASTVMDRVYDAVKGIASRISR